MTPHTWQSNEQRKRRQNVPAKRPVKPRRARPVAKPRPARRRRARRQRVRKPPAKRQRVRKPPVRKQRARRQSGSPRLVRQPAKPRPAAKRDANPPAGRRLQQPNLIGVFYARCRAARIFFASLLHYTVRIRGTNNQTPRNATTHTAPAHRNATCRPTSAANPPTTSEPPGTTPMAIIV